MNGTGWTAITGTNFLPNPTGAALTPYAIDFDNLGRIYIANFNSGIGGLLRIDDINHASTSGAVVDSALGMTSLAIDRTNGLIYYSNGTANLFEKAVANIISGPTTISLLSESLLQTGPKSMAVDDQGILYMVIQSTTSYVVKYNPGLAAGSRVVASSTYSFTSPWGIMVKGPYVYVGDSGAGKIVRLDKNLLFVDSFSGPPTDLFYGPETFVAVLNRKFTVIDEKSNFFDRLTSFDDMSGASWTTYGSYGNSISGPGHFDFYSIC